MKRVMWFRRDLRLQDNKALAHALQNSAADELILLFQMNPQQFIQESANHNAFFASLASFKERIDQEAHLQIMVGEPLDLFSRLKRKLPDWQAIYFNEDTCGFGAKRDQQAMRFFEENNIQSFSFQDAYLHGSEEIKKNDGSKYQVFTPREQIARIPLTHYSVGEETARRRLNTFIDQKLQSYENKRDFPYQDQTSHLSTFLRTGELSIRTIWQELASASSSLSKETFKKELAWRDFYNMIYSTFPQQKEEAIQEKFRYIQWTNDPEMFAKWQKGETGYPIIDAAMRQLNQTGWMHNRLRMITASFLVKNLHIDWRWGEKYFQKMLIDYDAANNIGGWQWAASTGTDAVPYFRIFNPIIQSKKFDNDGQFIKKYVPELKQVPQKYIHQPNLMNEALQTQYHVHLGENYPKPIVDYASSKKQTLFLYEASKEIHQEMNNPRFK
ncbi:cryptochrome/photolyase family protein [Enterococcus sp. DIV0015]|uniref:cryptochrome/photolyase family protein n=1 Tax=Enterococcus sp. DIV0015 TaxID=2774900 RepID=UPI003D2FAE8B